MQIVRVSASYIVIYEGIPEELTGFNLLDTWYIVNPCYFIFRVCQTAVSNFVDIWYKYISINIDFPL